MDNLIIIGEGSFAAQLLAKADVSGEARDKEGKWTAGGEVQHLNAHKVTLREDGQQKEHVAELSEKVGDGPIENPIIAYKDHKGIHVIDGHHRTLVAREKGIPLPAIVISKAKYEQLSAEGHYDTKIKLAYAREQASGNRNTPQLVHSSYLHGAPNEDDKVTADDLALLKELHKFEHVDISQLREIAKRDIEKADVSEEARDDKGRWTKGDSDYLDAVKSGDVKEQQRMVTEAATKAGYTAALYHGSDQQRDVFDGGIFLTDSKQDASAYAELRALHKAVDDNDDLSEIVSEVLAEQGGESLTDLGPRTIRDIADANGIELENVEGHVSKMLVKSENPLDLTEHGSDVGDVKGLWDDMHKAKLLDTPWKDLDEEVQDEIKDKYMGQALYRFLEEEGIQSKAFDSGHDAVIFTDMSPDGGKTHTSWLVKSNTQFKSSAPITYDEDGKIVPLSKRFDSSSSDVRKTDVSEEARDKDGKWTTGKTWEGVAYRGEAKSKPMAIGAGVYSRSAHGTGKYFGMAEEDAARFSVKGTVEAHTVRLEKAYVINSDADVLEMRRLAAEASGKPISQDYLSLLDKPEGDALAEGLTKLGYDGVVVNYKEANGGKQIVQFNPPGKIEKGEGHDVSGEKRNKKGEWVKSTDVFISPGVSLNDKFMAKTVVTFHPAMVKHGVHVKLVPLEKDLGGIDAGGQQFSKGGHYSREEKQVYGKPYPGLMAHEMGHAEFDYAQHQMVKALQDVSTLTRTEGSDLLSAPNGLTRNKRHLREANSPQAKVHNALRDFENSVYNVEGHPTGYSKAWRDEDIQDAPVTTDAKGWSSVIRVAHEGVPDADGTATYIPLPVTIPRHVNEAYAEFNRGFVLKELHKQGIIDEYETLTELGDNFDAMGTKESRNAFKALRKAIHESAK